MQKQKLYCYVDGLKRTERHHFGSELRHLGVSVRKVRGMRDQSDELIRLADAIAGFVRDALGGDTLMKALFERAINNHVLKRPWGNEKAPCEGLFKTTV